MIDKIGGMNPLSSIQNTRRANGSEKINSGADTVSVSDDAKAMAEKYYMQQIAQETSDVRQNRVAEIKEKIKDSSYLNSAVIASAADRIMDSFGL
ncbi:MAG: flagellar biosynthesis anti-sigma factor FlgM [Treponema sp.]